MYVRPPKEGIPGVLMGCLIALVKGVFCVRESPRLWWWWLRLRESFFEAGVEELKLGPATFVLR